MTDNPEKTEQRQAQPDAPSSFRVPGGIPPHQDAKRLLRQIRAGVNNALDALADEHEGNFRQSVLFLELDAEALAKLVRSW